MLAEWGRPGVKWLGEPGTKAPAGRIGPSWHLSLSLACLASSQSTIRPRAPVQGRDLGIWALAILRCQVMEQEALGWDRDW